MRIPSNARLQFDFRVRRRRLPVHESRVIVSSNYPEPFAKVFVVKPGLNTIGLENFVGKVVRLTFQTTRFSGSGNRFDEVLWGMPSLKYTASAPQDGSEKWEDFRRRHSRDNVLLVLFDALNPLHLGCYGYNKRTSPTIDSLAAEGILWRNAIAQAAYTRASTPVLLTGLYPHDTGVVADTVLDERFRTLAEAFRDSRYETALFTSNPNASGEAGYGQGYGEIHALYRKNEHPLEKDPVMADEFLRPVTGWLDRVGHRPFFAHLHFREPHPPWLAPQSYVDRFLSSAANPDERENRIARYDGSLAYADEQLGRILQQLDTRGLSDRTTIVFLSDHGEAFGEHGFFGHMSPVYEEQIRIPLIMRFAGEERLHNLQRDELAGTIDLMPTFQELFGFSYRGLMARGKNLVQGLFHQPPDRSRILVSIGSDGSAYALRSQDWKYIVYPQNDSGREELFCLAEDPGETRNRIKDFPILAAYYRIEWKRWLEETSRFRKEMGGGMNQVEPPDEQTREQLRALGYIE